MAKREIRAMVRCGGGTEEYPDIEVSYETNRLSSEVVVRANIFGRHGYPISISLSIDNAQRLLTDLSRAIEGHRERMQNKSPISK